MNLSRLAGKRVAIVLTIEGRRRVLSGEARYEREQALGNVLRIPIDGLGDADAATAQSGGAAPCDARSGRPEFVIQESQWNGRVIPDEMHGCDYCLYVTEAQAKSVVK
jgi:hypothetical protein